MPGCFGLARMAMLRQVGDCILQNLDQLGLHLEA